MNDDGGGYTDEFTSTLQRLDHICAAHRLAGYYTLGEFQTGYYCGIEHQQARDIFRVYKFEFL